MFNQKRRNTRNIRNWIWVAVAVTAVAFAVVLLLGYLGRNNYPSYEQTNGTDRIYSHADQTQENVETDEIDEQEDVMQYTEEEDEEKESFQSYYLVKYDKDVIRIFFSDSTGKLMELEETTIIYETLSEEDQKRFDDGVKLESRDALNKLLMDYES